MLPDSGERYVSTPFFAPEPRGRGPGVSLRERDGAAGAPWDRPFHGTLDKLVVESELLAGNPLGDPAHRPLWVYLPPGVERDHPEAAARRST